MNIEFSQKLHQFCEKKQIHQFFLSVNLIEEPCLQIYRPAIIFEQKNLDKDEFQLIGTHDGVEIYRNQEFLDRFGKLDHLHFTVKGLLKKHVILENVDPIIKNVCKVPT